MDEGDERVARNHAAFRDANERIARFAAAELPPDERILPFLCECSDPACTTLIRLRLDEYARVRSDPGWFLCVPDHLAAAGRTGRVVSEHEEYLVIEQQVPQGEQRSRAMDEVTGERIGRNEAVFRQVNEQIEAVNRAFATLTETMEVVCECGDLACTDRFLLSIQEYERLRADPTHFAVRPGHEIPEVEHVVEEHGEYLVVRKDPGMPAEIAEATDPRRD